MLKSLSIYIEANMLKVCLYGFIGGMSLLLSGNTINFWLSSSGIDIKNGMQLGIDNHKPGLGRVKNCL